MFPGTAVVLGAAYTLTGRVAEAVSLRTQAMEQTAVLERGDLPALCLLPLGEVHLRAGHLEQAHALAKQALELTRAHQERGNEADALRLFGEIGPQQEPPEIEQAEAYYQQALALAEELGMRPLQAHCPLGLGTLYTKTGQQVLARTELSTVIERYRAMDMTFWLPQAEGALAQMDAR
jgi:tetratricopeptide (TPR) repeat protein